MPLLLPLLRIYKLLAFTVLSKSNHKTGSNYVKNGCQQDICNLLMVGRHLLDGLGCLCADQIQSTRGGTGGHSHKLIHEEAKGPLEDMDFCCLLFRWQLVTCALKKRMFPEALAEGWRRMFSTICRVHISLGNMG